MDKKPVITKINGYLSLICLAVTMLWLVLMIYGEASSGQMDTFRQVLAHHAKLDALYYLTYINAAAITIVVTMLVAGLFIYCKDFSFEWSVIALVFVPVYTVLNLVACIMGIAGIALGNNLLSNGSFVGGILFLFSLVALSWTFLRKG